MSIKNIYTIDRKSYIEYTDDLDVNVTHFWLCCPALSHELSKAGRAAARDGQPLKRPQSRTARIQLQENHFLTSDQMFCVWIGAAGRQSDLAYSLKPVGTARSGLSYRLCRFPGNITTKRLWKNHSPLNEKSYHSQQCGGKKPYLFPSAPFYFTYKM